MRCLTSFIAGILLAGAVSGAVLAQGADGYPSRPVKIVIAAPPGGSTDLVARVLADKLTQKWGQPVIVENRPGGASNIGAAYVAGAEPDGYTLFWGTPGPLAINKLLFRKLNYDPDKFVPVSLVFSGVNVLLVPAEFASSLDQFIARARAMPNQLTYASTGVGTNTHLSGELLQQLGGLKMAHAPYRGSPMVFPDLVAGRVQAFFMTLDASLPYIRNGSVRALAVGSDKRNPLLPDVPALSEVYPGFSSTTWSGIVAPAGTPTPIVVKVSEAIARIMQLPEVAKPLRDVGNEPVGGGPAQLRQMIEQDQRIWGGVIRATGVQVD